MIFSTRRHTFTSGNRRHQHLGLSVLLISNNSKSTRHKPGIISRVSNWSLKKTLRYQVNMFFLYDSHVLYMLSSEIDLRKNPHLRLLQFNLNLYDSEFRKSQDDVIRWLNSICESVTSKSLVVEVREFYEKVESCNKIQDTLLALYERIETFSVYLTLGTKEKGLFSKLYEVVIVVEEDIRYNEDKRVGDRILTSN